MEPIISIAKSVAQIVQAIPPEKLACVNNATLVDVYLEQLREGNLSGRAIDLFAILKSYFASTSSDNLITPELVEYNEKLRLLTNENSRLSKRLSDLESDKYEKLVDRLDRIESENCLRLPSNVEERLERLEKNCSASAQAQNTIQQAPIIPLKRIETIERELGEMKQTLDDKMDFQQEEESVKTANILIANINLAKTTLLDVQNTIVEARTIIFNNSVTIQENTTIINNFDRNLESVRTSVNETTSQVRKTESQLEQVQLSVQDLVKQLKNTKRSGNPDDDDRSGAGALVTSVKLDEEVRNLVDRVVDRRYKNELSEITLSHKQETDAQRSLIEKFTNDIQRQVRESRAQLETNYNEAAKAVATVGEQNNGLAESLSSLQTQFTAFKTELNRQKVFTETSLNRFASLVGLDAVNGIITDQGNLGRLLKAATEVDQLNSNYKKLSDQISKAQATIQNSLQQEINEYRGLRKQEMDELATLGGEIDSYAKMIANILSELRIFKDAEQTEIETTPLLNVRNTIDAINYSSTDTEPTPPQTNISNSQPPPVILPQPNIDTKNVETNIEALVNAKVKSSLGNPQSTSGGSSFLQQRLAQSQKVKTIRDEQEEQAKRDAQIRQTRQREEERKSPPEPDRDREDPNEQTSITTLGKYLLEQRLAQSQVQSGRDALESDDDDLPTANVQVAQITSSRDIAGQFRTDNKATQIVKVGKTEVVGKVPPKISSTKKFTERGLAADDVKRALARAARQSMQNYSNASNPVVENIVPAADVLGKALNDDEDMGDDNFYETQTDFPDVTSSNNVSSSISTLGKPSNVSVPTKPLSFTEKRLGKIRATTEPNADEGSRLNISNEAS